MFCEIFVRDGKKQHRWKQVSNQKWLWILQIRFRGSIPSVPGFCASSFRSSFEKAFNGLLRSHSQEKEAKGSRLSEGKYPMSFSLYKILCAKIMADVSKEAIFAHAFLTLNWNLVCRSKNTVFIDRTTAR